MSTCVRAGCAGAALAPWWSLCSACTLPLLEPASDLGDPVVDQHVTAGWDALDWAERIAPDRWGNAVEDDPWIVARRCLAFAAVTTGRSQGCSHTGAPTVAVPVVAVARAPGVLRCPPCAETVVRQHTTTGHSCDRCQVVTVGPPDRVAALTGASLIIVGQLCRSCTDTVLSLTLPVVPDGR